MKKSEKVYHEVYQWIHNLNVNNIWHISFKLVWLQNGHINGCNSIWFEKEKERALSERVAFFPSIFYFFLFTFWTLLKWLVLIIIQFTLEHKWKIVCVQLKNYLSGKCEQGANVQVMNSPILVLPLPWLKVLHLQYSDISWKRNESKFHMQFQNDQRQSLHASEWMRGFLPGFRGF